MKMTNMTIAMLLLGVALVGGLVYARNHSETKPTESIASPYDAFAECIAQSGAKFYGTWWCPHCKAQKEAFQNSKKLPYTECSTTDGKGQLPVCAEAGIESYPTWVFPDGTRLTGEQTFATLAEKTACVAPTE